MIFNHLKKEYKQNLSKQYTNFNIHNTSSSRHSPNTCSFRDFIYPFDHTVTSECSIHYHSLFVILSNEMINNKLTVIPLMIAYVYRTI